MKTSEEIKNWLAEAPHIQYSADDPSCCGGYDVRYAVAVGYVLRDNIVSRIQQLERKLEEEHEMCEFYRAKDKRQGSIISQVSKVLCGKENTTYDEFYQAVSQVKSCLVKVEREKIELLKDFKICVDKPKKACRICNNRGKPICSMCENFDVFEWRGVCEENTKE